MSDSTALVVLPLMLLPFIFAALKGRVALGIVGFFGFLILTRAPTILALAGLYIYGKAIYRSFTIATPGSVWARLFYGEEKLALATERHAEANGEEAKAET